MVTCPNCGGSGRITGPVWLDEADRVTKPCPTCRGSAGKVQSKYTIGGICAVCKGWGREVEGGGVCPLCRGRGMRLPE